MKINLNTLNSLYRTQTFHVSSSNRLLQKLKSSQLASSANSSLRISDSGTLRNLYSKELLQTWDSEEAKYVSSDMDKSEVLNSMSPKDLLNNFGRIYKYINENMSGSEKKLHLEALDAAYNNIASDKADVIATSFDNVFDFAANQLPAYGMKGVESIIDKDTFSQNVTKLLINAKTEFIKNLSSMDFNSALKEALKTSGRSDKLNALEDMSLEDIANISGIIKTGFRTTGDLVKDMLKRSNSYDKIIDILNLSDSLRAKLDESKKENIKAFAKIKVYKEEIDYNQQSLEKLGKKLKKLNELLSSMEDRLEKSTDMDQKLRLLKRAAGVRNQIGDLNKEIKKIEERQKKLKEDPDSIEDYDKFKDAMNEYNSVVKNKP